MQRFGFLRLPWKMVFERQFPKFSDQFYLWFGDKNGALEPFSKIIDQKDD